MSQLAKNVGEALEKLKKAEIILSVGFEDEDLKKIAVDIKEAREILIGSGLSIVGKAIETENQQKKWLKALQIVDEGLSDLEDSLTQEEFDVIISLRKRLDQLFQDQ